MGDIIVWKTAEEVAKLLITMNEAVSGMSTAEAATALGFSATKNGMYVKTVADIVSFTGSATTAGEVIAGTSATGSATTSVVNLTLYTTAEGSTAVGALGSIALPIAACCLVGAAGFALGDVIGDTIDKACPNFFQGLFESISTLVTGDKYGLAFIYTADNRIYMQEDAQKAVKTYIEENIEYPAGEETFSMTLSDMKIADDTYGNVTYSITKLNVNDTFLGYTVTNIICETPVYLLPTYYYFMGTSLTIKLSFLSTSDFTIECNSNDYGSQSFASHEKTWRLDGYDFSGNYVTYGFYQCVCMHTYTGSYGLDDLPCGAGFFDYNYTDIMTKLHPLALKTVLESTGSTGSGQSTPICNDVKITPYEVPEIPRITTPTEMPNWVPVELPKTSPTEMPDTIPQLEPEPVATPDTVSPYLPQPAPYPANVPLPTPSPTPNPNPITVPQVLPRPVEVPEPEIDPSIDPVPTPEPDPESRPDPPDSGQRPVPPLPVVPPISSAATGLLHVYNPTIDQVNEFGKWLWTTFSGDLVDTVAKLFNNPMEAVIGLHELYCTPSTGNTTTIKAGFLDSDVTSRLVNERYTEINCGAITIPEYWGNYLDYAPYTKVYCYLPFIGIVELNTNDIIGHGVQVLYKIDSYNGSCVAMIITAKNSGSEAVKYQFSGNCAVEVPITSGMKSSIQSALIGAATCAVGVSTGGGAKAVARRVLKAGGSGAVRAGLNNNDSVSHSGTFGSSFGAMGIKTPYFIVKRPIQKVVPNYNEKYGYPAHRMVTVGNCSGFLIAKDFEVLSTTATEEEKKRIEILLKEGVYV